MYIRTIITVNDSSEMIIYHDCTIRVFTVACKRYMFLLLYCSLYDLSYLANLTIIPIKAALRIAKEMSPDQSRYYTIGHLPLCSKKVTVS